MRDDEFRAWLEAGGAQTEAGRNTRVHAVRTIENNLSRLGSPYEDLEAAWKADEFNQLRQRLKALQEDFQKNGTEYRILMPQSEKPLNRLSSWRSWLGQYGQFLRGEPRGERDADRIRRYVLEQYIEPARERNDDAVDVLVRDVNDALALNQAWPNICQALKGQIFLEMADLDAPEQDGADQSSATVFHFSLTGAGGSVAGAGRPFLLFDAAGDAFQPVRHYNSRTGRSAYRIKPPGASNEADEALEVDSMIDVARAMLVDGRPARLQGLPRPGNQRGPVNYLSYGKQKLVRYELDPVIAREIGVPSVGRVGDETIAGDFANSGETREEKERSVTLATNLILYGPPGTGKTYVTAVEAIRLCGEKVPDGREEVMAAYRRLSDQGRIEFVTFHQSISYEDFVEGLRPVQASESGAAGFELKPIPGVFRRISRRAETSTGPGTTNYSIGGRQVFKMSIGEAASADDAHLFEEAIVGGYALLGFEDIDWSDARFEERDAIKEAVREKGLMDDEVPTSMSGRVQMPFIFRNGAKVGDIVVVSKGNSLFRAIGEITGTYQFAPREGGGYAHRRAVRWLWIDRAGVQVSEIYARGFTMKSIYLLNVADLNVPALERYIASQQDEGAAAPESFVLIIDEINRANISKVFGELITLLESDKRLGQLNELKVRLPYSGEIFGVPSNLHIIGTMNTADRSIALLDTALRRRFDFRELMPDPTQLGTVDGINLRNLLTALNQGIEYLFDREHQIGHAYFLGCNGRSEIDAVMRHKVIPLLAEYFYEDWAKVAAVLGDGSDGDGDREGNFIDRRSLTPPKGTANLEDVAPRFTWKMRDTFSYETLAGE